jgi:hypothetical protein
MQMDMPLVSSVMATSKPLSNLATVAATGRRDFLRRASGVALGAVVVAAVGGRAAASVAGIPGATSAGIALTSDRPNLVVNGGFEVTNDHRGAAGWSFVP